MSDPHNEEARDRYDAQENRHRAEIDALAIDFGNLRAQRDAAVARAEKAEMAEAERDAARRIACWYFAKCGTLMAEWALKHGDCEWIGWINRDTGPVSNSHYYKNGESLDAAEQEGADAAS